MESPESSAGAEVFSTGEVEQMLERASAQQGIAAPAATVAERRAASEPVREEEAAATRNPRPELRRPEAPAEGGNPAATSRTPPAPLHPPRSAQPFDFRKTAWLTPLQQRRWRSGHEEFALALAARLSIFLRVEFSVKVGRLETLPYARFTAGLPAPAHVTLFKLEPLRGIGLCELTPGFGAAIVDRLLGGPGRAGGAREFSEIELALLDQFTQLFLNEWTGHWTRLQPMQAVLLGHENTAGFLQTSAPDAAMLVLGLECGFGESTGALQLAVPLATLEGLLRELGRSPVAEAAPAAPAPAPAAPPKWRPALNDLPVALRAAWPEMRLTVRELSALKPGDVLALDPEAAGRVELRVGPKARFAGRLGTDGARWAVEIAQVLKR
jgi:flagellar motor switch protein FliM